MQGRAIAHRSPANAQWGRLSTRKLEDELSAKKRLRSESASKKIDDGGEAENELCDNEALKLQRFRFNDRRSLPPAREDNTPSVQLWWNRENYRRKGGGADGGSRKNGNKRSSANSVKRMYFDLSQLSAPWSPPGGHRGSSFRSKQTIFESSTMCASTRC